MTLHDLVAWLITQSPPVGLALVVAGLVFLLGGYSIYKVLLGVSFAAIGLTAGVMFLSSAELVLLCGIGTCGVGTIAGRVFPRTTMSVLAGACGGLTVWYAFGNSFGFGPAPAIVAGFIVGGLALAWMSMMYLDVVAVIMSYEGTLLALAGFVILMDEMTNFLSFSFRALMRGYPFFGYFMVAVITIAGALYQSALLRQVDAAGEFLIRAGRGKRGVPISGGANAGPGRPPARPPSRRQTVTILGIFDFFESGDLYIREDDGRGGVTIDYEQTFEAKDWLQAREAVLAHVCQLASGHWPLPQTREHWNITVHWPDGSVTQVEKDWCGEWCGVAPACPEQSPPGVSDESTAAGPSEAAPASPAESPAGTAREALVECAMAPTATAHDESLPSH